MEVTKEAILKFEEALKTGVASSDFSEKEKLVRDSKGNVYRYELKAAWTREEWEAETLRLRAEKDAIQAEIDAYPKPPKDWPEEAKELWRQTHGLGLFHLEWRLSDVVSRLSKMEEFNG